MGEVYDISIYDWQSYIDFTKPIYKGIMVILLGPIRKHANSIYEPAVV
jgi:hypothetical protein